MTTTISGSGPASISISVATSSNDSAFGPDRSLGELGNPDPDPRPNTLVATWPATEPGNSPIDAYLVTITGSDAAGTFMHVSETTLTTYFNVD